MIVGIALAALLATGIVGGVKVALDQSPESDSGTKPSVALDQPPLPTSPYPG
jgi:hypothetical protein